ncbi:MULTISPECIES: hypothetical protein [unclassified Streptomyces]|uniref:hypothetical protein n=1 Tax=Streptomyces sp. NPDC127532 TaxID=3345399 RepID=UPI00362CAF24
MTAELREKGHQVNEKAGHPDILHHRDPHAQTRPSQRPRPFSPVADLFQRDFTAVEPGRKYMGDIG